MGTTTQRLTGRLGRHSSAHSLVAVPVIAAFAAFMRAFRNDSRLSVESATTAAFFVPHAPVSCGDKSRTARAPRTRSTSSTATSPSFRMALI